MNEVMVLALVLCVAGSVLSVLCVGAVFVRSGQISRAEEDEHAHYGRVDCLSISVLYPVEGEDR